MSKLFFKKSFFVENWSVGPNFYNSMFISEKKKTCKNCNTKIIIVNWLIESVIVLVLYKIVCNSEF